MPIDFVYETALTIDHEAGTMLVDTTRTGIALALLRAGFIETTAPSSHPYRRFRGAADQLRFRKPKGQRQRPPEGVRFAPGRAVSASATA